ncbi:MAG: hypothetical protein P1V97_24740 [Planctomycetota bacterium]|nr:hypothetical protein [Planctomycetota bacterium]
MFEELTPPKRVHYFDGQALHAEDFAATARYLSEKRQQDRRFLHGYGAVDIGRRQSFQIRVDPEHNAALLLGPGYGLDKSGRDLRIPEEQKIVLDQVWLESEEPTLVYLVLRVTEVKDDLWVDPDNPTCQGFRRVREETRAHFTSTRDPQESGLEIARILLHGASGALPGPTVIEINQDQLPRIRASRSMTEQQKSALSKTIRSLTKQLGLLTSLGWNSVTDLRTMLCSLNITACSSGFDSRDWASLGRVLSLAFQDFQQDLLRGEHNDRSPSHSFLHKLHGSLKDLGSGAQDHSHAITSLQELASALKQFLSNTDADELEDEPEHDLEQRFNELEETISAEEDLGDRAAIPETIMIQGQLYHLIDEVVLLDDDSEAEHQLTLENSEDAETATKTYRYPDGRARSAQGRIFSTGTLEWSFLGLEDKGDVLVACRADVGEDDCRALLRVGDQEPELWVTSKAEEGSRWRNGIKAVSAPFIEDGRLKCQLKPSKDTSLRIFGLWLYQAQS